ncbi:hypothetical protein XA68_15154 [Ophiocordyceps unilateralis]|uniref:Ribosomal protein L5 C-terminal domain-containing protein n=1 Tax=Ophiocordyceps unilateralis TaxID=268505 RepID=A0A2A9P778_OPHUN|nr:hypothetical protein XA68_15154 [Ophiocordyceps unilateralis]
MAAVRDGFRMVRALCRHVRPSAPTMAPVAPRRASNEAAAASRPAPDLSDLESTASFTSPGPSRDLVEKFDQANRLRWEAVTKREARRLPGNRYQYHPPKFNRGPLHPIQVPKSSDPIARDFVPGPFNYPRLKHTHVPPGTAPAKSRKGTLRSWDDSSPYHKNRPMRKPRGTSSTKLPLIERDITWHNVPEIRAVTLNAYCPGSGSDKEYLHVVRAVLQAITGQFPALAVIRKSVSSWDIKEGNSAGAVVTLRNASAFEFIDKLVTLVLPKIKDWPGVRGTSGDGSGNLALGMKPEWMMYFPEIEYNYDMYPEKLVPGCHIIIHTSATSDRQGRLLLQALGFPFFGKVTD